MEHQDGTALLNSVDPTPSNQAATGRAIPQEWFMTRPPVRDAAMKRRRRVRIGRVGPLYKGGPPRRHPPAPSLRPHAGEHCRGGNR